MKFIYKIFLLLFLSESLSGQTDSDMFWSDAQKGIGGEKSQAAQKKMEWWRNARFGLMIHWNMSSLVGAQISWGKDFTDGGKIENGRPGFGSKESETNRWWDGIMPKVPASVYDNLHKSFYPGMFDADSLVAIAKKAGMKYIIMVAKHHDGFCMWPSKYTEYDIKNTPYRKNVLSHLAKATKKAGLKFGVYYSQRDWCHPDYQTNPPKYVEYMHNQIKELLKKYKEISILIFDAENYPEETWQTENLFKMIGKVRPDLLVNNRCGVPGDYITLEERIGSSNDRDWESIMTFGGKFSWGNFHDDMISFKEFVEKLVRCAGSDGNLLMNVNPLPTGEIDPRQIELMQEMGIWLRRYGESIYGTKSGPMLPGGWGASTQKDSTVYLHILDWSKLPKKIANIGPEFISYSLLTGGQVELLKEADSIIVNVPEESRDEIDTIIKIKLNTKAINSNIVDTNPTIVPVNSEASANTRALLSYLQSISGKKTLTGQHNFIGRMSTSTDRVAEITGKYPAIWGSDFGFADSTWDHDNIKYRALLVNEIKKQHNYGSIIILTYHQAIPTMGEPCPWIGGVNGAELTFAEWDSLLTEGTSLNRAWIKQMDVIAGYLKVLRDSDIPILWRPYHEMNGGWFWWGGKREPNGFITLWKKLFDYYTNHHNLNNLIWVWSPDKPWFGLKDFYPGHEYVDIISVDIYPHSGYPVVFRQKWYEEVLKLADGKLIAIGENGSLPMPQELNTQPNWLWFMSWAGLLEKQNSRSDIINLYNAPHILTRDEIEIGMK